jgi:uncharacterized membrane protein YhaH (DUF805 family)
MLSWIRTRFMGFDGRIDRVTFFTRYASLYAVVFIPATAAIYQVVDTAPDGVAAPLISAFAALLVMVGSVSLLVRRFHDFGLPGYAVAFYFGLGAVIGVLRAIALAGALDVERIVGRESIAQLVMRGEVNFWLLVWYLPALAWAMTPFLIPSSPGANRFGALPIRRARRDRAMDVESTPISPAPF